jgi:hypothetical protein
MVLHLDTSLSPHNLGRGMTATTRTPTLTPMFTLMLCDYAEAAAIKVLGRAGMARSPIGAAHME